MQPTRSAQCKNKSKSPGARVPGLLLWWARYSVGAAKMVSAVLSVSCGACVVELPSLLAYRQSHPRVWVLAVAVTDKPNEVQEFLRKKHLDQLHVAVISQMPAVFSEGLPTTAVSPAGQLAFVREGASADITTVLQNLTQFQRQISHLGDWLSGVAWRGNHGGVFLVTSITASVSHNNVAFRGRRTAEACRLGVCLRELARALEVV